MKIAFFSAYLNHHQEPFCNVLSKISDFDFTFVSFKPMRAERVALGYEDMNNYSYVLKAYNSKEEYTKAEQLALCCDVAVFGSAPTELLIKRVNLNKPTIIYSERLFKKGFYQTFSPRTLRRMKKTHSSFKNKKVYLFCASAFTAADYARFGAYKNKAYKWGYFPAVKRYENFNHILNSKQQNSILWVGRMLEWKHPEYAINLAKRLKKSGYNFTLNMIGTGPLEEKLKEKVKKYNLSNCVSFLGSMSPEEVRKYMEQSEIFLFTSDRHEGWGAVLNESMNSGCAVVASSSIGAVPFLLKNEENGLVFKSGSVIDLYLKTKTLLENKQKCKALGVSAYKTVTEEWSVENAGLRFYEFCKNIQNHEILGNLFEEGPVSKAYTIKG